MQSTATLPVIGMDIAKNVFQLHVVDAETGEVTRHKLRRDRVTTFFANRQRSLVALEACGGAHHCPDGHPKLPHLWPVKLLQAGRSNYDDSVLIAMRAAASLRR